MITYTLDTNCICDVDERRPKASAIMRLVELHNKGTAVSYSLSTTDGGGVPPSDLTQVASFQVTFGGNDDGQHATFSSGEGVIVLQADQPMNVDTSYPTCIGFIGGTAETSNMGYGALGATPSTLFSQAFGVVPDIPYARITRRVLPPLSQGGAPDLRRAI